jgi:hypothetical protein
MLKFKFVAQELIFFKRGALPHLKANKYRV